MTLLEAELYGYYAVVALLLTSACLQARNVRKAGRRHALAGRAAGDPGRRIVTGCDLANEWLRLATHAALFVSTGWLLLLRYIPPPQRPPQLVSYLFVVSGLAVTPLLLLATSYNVERRDRRLAAPVEKE